MYKHKIPEIKTQCDLNEGKVNMAFLPYARFPGEIGGLVIEVSICPFPSGTLFRFTDIDTSEDSVDIVSTSYQFIPGVMMVACNDNTDQDIHLYDEAGFNAKSLRILFDEEGAKWRKLSRKNIDEENTQAEEIVEEDDSQEDNNNEDFVDNSVEVYDQAPEQEKTEDENDGQYYEEVGEEPEPEPEPVKEEKPHIRSIGARQETSRKEPMKREEPERKPERQKDDRRERQERRENKAFNGGNASVPQQRQPQQNQRQRFDQRQKGNVQERPQQTQQQPRRDNRPQEQPRRDNNGGKGNRNEGRQHQQPRKQTSVSKPSFDFSGIVKQAYSN